MAFIITIFGMCRSVLPPTILREHYEERERKKTECVTETFSNLFPQNNTDIKRADEVSFLGFHYANAALMCSKGILHAIHDDMMPS